MNVLIQMAIFSFNFFSILGFYNYKSKTTYPVLHIPCHASKPLAHDHGSEIIRLNKCITSLSRRAADEAIIEQHATINNNISKLGDKVKYGDIVKLDGKIQKWSDLARA